MAIGKKLIIGGGLAAALLLLAPKAIKATNILRDLIIKPGLPRIHSINEGTIVLIVPVSIFNYSDFSPVLQKFSIRVYYKDDKGIFQNFGISPTILKFKIRLDKCRCSKNSKEIRVKVGR